MKISIVIPNYNGEELLRKNLPKTIHEITKLRNYEIEIVIVDDGSADGSIEYIKMQNAKCKNINQKINIKVIENKTNLGFSSTVNKGVREAAGEIVILLNTDVYPEENFIQPLLIHFKDPKVFAVGMMDKSREGSKIVRRGRGIAWWEKGFYVHKRGEIDKKDTAWVSGGSGAFRKSIWEKLGGFDEIFSPFYWEDIDLSYRAKKAGCKILFEPKSVVVHEHSLGPIKRQYSSSYIKTISFRNQFIFVWKNANFKQLITHFFWFFYHLISLKDLDFLIGFFMATAKIRMINRKK